MNTRTIMRQFDKEDLFCIAKELGLEVTNTISSRRCISIIAADMDENGVPAAEDCSEKMEDFLKVAGYIDANGDLLDTVEEEDYQEESKEVSKVGAERPQCFSYYSEFDPACKRCKVAQACKVERGKVVMSCYGKLFSPNSEECKACIENLSCRNIVEKES